MARPDCLSNTSQEVAATNIAANAYDAVPGHAVLVDSILAETVKAFKLISSRTLGRAQSRYELHDMTTLFYFRCFPDNYGRCAVYDLFGVDDVSSGYFSQQTDLVEWEYPCEFADVDYGEPLECVHARRAAFGGSEARFAESLEKPDRALIFSLPNQRMDAYRHVSINWKLTGVMEVPKYCIHSATSDYCRVRWGFGEQPMETLKAALTLVPSQYDVFGFCTPDQRLVGAVEFTGEKIGENYQTHVFVAANERSLVVGDELWGWYRCKIGETIVEARRLLAVVEHIPELPVPKLT